LLEKPSGIRSYKSNIIYVKDGDDIESAIAGASDGDTIILASATFEINDDIDVTSIS